MRIPYSKPYRAFPELDPFSDAQCEAMIATFQRGLSTQSEGCATGCGAASVAVVCVFVTARLVLVPLVMMFNQLWQRSDVLATIVIVVTVVMLFAGSWACMLLVRDRQLRRSIRRVLEHGAICTQCRYSLLGLPEVRDGQVRCPECGHLNTSDSALRALVRPEGARD